MWLIHDRQVLLYEFERLVPEEIKDHSLAVAEKARSYPGSLNEEVLFFAGLFHDIGKSEELKQTSFHALDGARYLFSLGELHLSPLVARHTGAYLEAKILGISLAPWDNLSSIRETRLAPYQRILDRSDLTTAPRWQ